MRRNCILLPKDVVNSIIILSQEDLIVFEDDLIKAMCENYEAGTEEVRGAIDYAVIKNYIGKLNSLVFVKREKFPRENLEDNDA